MRHGRPERGGRAERAQSAHESQLGSASGRALRTLDGPHPPPQALFGEPIGGRRLPHEKAVHEIKSALILQPGPAALTDGLSELHRLISEEAFRAATR